MVNMLALSVVDRALEPWYIWKIAELALNNNHSLTKSTRTIYPSWHDHINLQVYQILKCHNIAISDKLAKPWSIENWAHIESWCPIDQYI